MKTNRRRRGFRTILCAVDFSPCSRAALRYAAAVARRFDGRVIVLFVNDPLLVAAAAAAYDERGLVSTTMKELRRFVDRAIGEESVSGASCHVALGNPAVEIGKAARKFGCDLVVLGTRGLSGVKRVFLGSTSDRVLRQATVPVLAVSYGRQAREAPAATWPRRALAAIKPGAGERDDAMAAAAIARDLGARLLLVSVLPAVSAPSWLTFGRNATERARLRDAQTRLRQLANRIGRVAGTRVESHLLVGEPAEQIAAASLEEKVDLTIMRLKKRGGLLAGRQGSTTYRVLSQASAPVLAVPSRGLRAKG